MWGSEPSQQRENLFGATVLQFVSRPRGSLGFPGGSAGKESACNVGGLGSVPGLGRSPGEGIGYPLQNSAWRIPCTVSSLRLQRVGHDRESFALPGGSGVGFARDCVPHTTLLRPLCFQAWGIFFRGSGAVLLTLVQQLAVILALSQRKMSPCPPLCRLHPVFLSLHAFLKSILRVFSVSF